MKPLAALIVALGVLAVACGPSSDETELLERITALRLAGRLPGQASDTKSEFHARFEALDEELRAAPPALDDLAALDAFHRDALELVRLPAAACSRSPKLIVAREWTDRLIARARLAAQEPDGSAAAIESLETAFVLLSRLDDGTLIGRIVRLSQERWLIDALREIAPAVDGRSLRAHLDPYLHARGHDALRTTVGIEMASFLSAMEAVILNRGELTPNALEGLGLSDSGLVSGVQELIDRYEAILVTPEPCGTALGAEDQPDPGPRLQLAVREWHTHEVRLELARVALAIEAHGEQHGAWPEELADLEGYFPGGLPEPPCRYLRYAYSRSETEFRLTTTDLLDPGPDATRTAWTWPLGLGR